VLDLEELFSRVAIAVDVDSNVTRLEADTVLPILKEEELVL